MKRLSLLILFFCVATVAASIFDDSNPIRLVSDLESHFLHVIGQSRHALSFARFACKYGKRYHSDDEIKHRFQIFSDNLLLIRSINKKPLTYTLAVNHFADWTWEEFTRHRLGAAQNCSATRKGSHKLTDAVLPQEKDWRKEGIVSEVKDQGHCGSCWSFSTTGALEAAYAQAFGKNISLSEQQLVDCAGAFNNFGCNGGLPSQAFEYIKYNGGLETEDAYPYTGKDGVCKFAGENVAAQVIDSVNITLGSEDELKHAVAFVRPVSVAFEVVSGFQFYKKGVYTSNTCGSKPMDVNHAVLAVGYGVEDGIPYWLIKNSWGNDWGDNGYFKMELGKNMCVATCASYPILV
ncbi:thiol protease aleurain-like isoform X2 [Abrus precatorius]|uniref:Thiol protease aleurain-like isoform X2 n=1 Tax=Abrus precatorius TaxID=3816 RepID=A0A8B8JFK6_ABRPR|nr:thiol protease aleurain-like isoform X2 [Abrus precatorius]